MQVLFYFERYVDIRDVDVIVNYADQGWEIASHDPFHSYMVTLSKSEEIETDCPELYAKAVNEMGIGVHLSVVQFSYCKGGNWHIFKVAATGDFKEG